jgi:hypothetical protein
MGNKFRVCLQGGRSKPSIVSAFFWTRCVKRTSRRREIPTTTSHSRFDNTTRCSYLVAIYIANSCILIRSCCLIFCFSPGDKVALASLLMVEYVKTVLSCCSSLVLEDLDEVVLIEALSDETMDMLLRHEIGLGGIVVVCRW